MRFSMRSLWPGVLCAAAAVGWLGGSGGHALSKREIHTWRREIRQALFIPDVLPALNVQALGTFSPTPGIAVERITYSTEYGMRVPALLYRPESSKEKLPGIVIVPGHAGDKSSWYVYYSGILFAKAGAAVLTYDPIGEGERNDDHKSGTREHDKFIDVPGMPQRMGGLMITDVMQAVSYLRQRPDVDPHRIAVLGFSMGSFVTVLAGAVDPRIHSILVTGGGDLDGPGGYWDSSPAVMCQAGPYKALRFLGDRPAVIYALNARRGTTLILNGTADTVVDIPHHEADFFQDLRARTIAINGTRKNVFETYFVPGASHRPAWLIKPALIWLDKSLHFTRWKASDISALPQTTIRAWAAKSGVHLSGSSLREDQDAGIVTLDVNVPKLTQSYLDVLTLPQWERVRKQFVYSDWVRNAILAAEANKN